MVSKATERKDGLFQVPYYITLWDGSRKREFAYGHSATEAKEKRDRIVANAINGHPVNNTMITVEQYLTNWVEMARGIRESTRSGYKGEIRKHIIPEIGKVRLSRLNVMTIQKMMDSLIRKGVSPRTTQILKNILSKALKDAEIQNLVQPNITKYVKLETYHPKERKVWDESEAKRFLEAIKDNKYYPIFLMCMTYGLRRGEAIAIEWDDVDLETRVIHIRRQYTLVNGVPTICDLKTAGSVRDLPILPHIEKLLRQLAVGRDTGYLVSVNGSPINPASVDYEFKQIKKKANLPEVTLHSLRHFAATSLKNAGVTVKEAQEILGHSSPVTTMLYYQHSSIEDKRTALCKYAEKMSF
ncbi:site-specific integrase [Candidatus Saccharibacteria bacterium]|nr:site-specific integrase [Candidatus Saccharibacteria bacterium]